MVVDLLKSAFTDGKFQHTDDDFKLCPAAGHGGF